ncbi:MAG: CPBP family intramembrane metalloprotease [Planctomycetota bacterium]|nr:CPBP family intramembrane metalloprotease [Planctomycetota bacterium]
MSGLFPSGSAAGGAASRSGVAAAACTFLALVVTSTVLLFLITGGDVDPDGSAGQVEIGMLAQLGGSIAALLLALAWPHALPWRGDGAVLGPLVRYACALPVWLVIAVGTSLVWSALGWPLADQPHLSYFADAEPGFAWIGVLAAVCVVGPVLEELIFRGFLLEGLAARHGVPIAVSVSSVLFGLVHVGAGTVLILPISALGALFAWLRLRHGGLLAPILAHVAHNSLMVTVVTLAPDLLPSPG